MTDHDRVREFIAVARVRNGPVDVLVNNAGVIQVGPLEDMREEDFEESLRVHFWSALYTTLEVLPEMKQRHSGRIVNIASFGGKVAVPHMLPYTVGKFALVGFSNGLNSELKQHGIVVTTVCPGLMRTGSHLNAEFKGRHHEEYAWFAAGNAMPGLSMQRGERRIQDHRRMWRGDAEIVLGLPARIAADLHMTFPNLMAELLCADQRQRAARTRRHRQREGEREVQPRGAAGRSDRAHRPRRGAQQRDRRSRRHPIATAA